MKTPARLLLPAMLLASPLTLAQAPAPVAAAEAPAPSANSKLVSLRFSGPLREAVQKIAEAGGLSAVLSGDVGDTHVDVFLDKVSAEEALQTLAEPYGLRVSQKGRMVVLSPQGSAAASVTPPMPAMPAMPPMPPMPVMSPEEMDEVARAAEEAAREAAEEMEAHAAERMAEARERIRERMERVREAGRSGKDVVARGQRLVIKEGETVDSAVVYGGDLVIKGVVKDDAVAFGGNIDVVGEVEGDVTAFGGNVVLGSDSTVEGDVSTFGGSINRKEGAVVEGSIGAFGGESLAGSIARQVSKEVGRSVKEDHESEEASEEEDSSGGLPLFLLRFAMLFGLGFLGQLFFPARMRELGREIREQPVRSGLVGVLGVLALVPITAVLCITLIGIPVAFVLLLATVLTTALAFTSVAGELGARVPLLRGRKTQAFVLALGLLALLLLGSIPKVGPLFMIPALAVSLGAVIRTRFGTRGTGTFPPEPVAASPAAL